MLDSGEKEEEGGRERKREREREREEIICSVNVSRKAAIWL